MAKTRSMTRNQNHRDYSSSGRKRIKTCDKGGGAVAPWSDLTHDVLFLVMIQLGVFDFLAFSGVCKSWRLLALSIKNKFIVSKRPMFVCTSPHPYKKACFLEDFEGRKFKIPIPISAGRTCIGVTCGYLILFDKKTRDFWLVNPITRHELHFPDVPIDVFRGHEPVRAILVYSPSISEWVFVMASSFHCNIWFSIAGKQEWSYVSTTSHVYDVHAFKGKIYTLLRPQRWHLCEMKLYPKPILTLLETKDFFEKPHELCYSSPKFASYGKKLYVVDPDPVYRHKIYEIKTFDELKWVSRDTTRKEYKFFRKNYYLKHDTIPHPRSEYDTFADTDHQGGKGRFLYANTWYLFHDCFNVNLLHES